MWKRSSFKVKLIAPVYYCCEKLQLRCLTGFRICAWVTMTGYYMKFVKVNSRETRATSNKKF